MGCFLACPQVGSYERRPAACHNRGRASSIPMNSARPRLNSEHYRQMLVRDGERRFREWHTAFLNYQRQFLQEMKRLQLRSSSNG